MQYINFDASQTSPPPHSNSIKYDKTLQIYLLIFLLFNNT